MNRPASEHRAPTPAPATSRAVVLCAPGAPAPAVLVQALQKRRVEPLPVQDAFAAMLVMMRSDAASGGRAPALIVVTPALHGAGPLNDLVRAVRRRLPGAALWEFEPDGRPPLRALSLGGFSDHAHSANGATNGAPPVVVAPRSRPAAPTLRLTESPSAREPAHDRRDEQPSTLLSEEELAMLLADDLDTTSPR